MKKALLAIGLLVLLSGTVHADGLNATITGSCQGNNDLLNTLTNLPGCIVESFFSFIVNGLIASTQGFVDSTFKFLFSAPDPRWFCAPYNAVLAILESLFSIVLMGLALFFILRSNDVEGRVTAKKWLENMLVMIVLLSFSFPLFQMMLDLNTYLSTNLASDSMKTIFNPSASFTSAIFALLMLFLIVFMMMLTFLTLLVRYIMIPFLLLLFPVAIFLYFIPVTQSWGKTFFKIIAIVVFMTTIDALILLGLSSLFSAPDPNLADSLVRAFAALFGFGTLGLVNLALFVVAILSIITQSKALSAAVGISMLGRMMK